MNNNTELRARARANLGNSLFHSNWLMGVAVCAVGSLVANFFPLLLAGPIYFGLSVIFLKLARGGDSIKFDDLFVGFDLFGECLKLYFFEFLFVFLWSLIPIVGIFFALRKSYSYAMAFYIKVDNPQMEWREVLDRSTQMMEGHRWELFCLQFSFIGWVLLGLCACCVGELWVEPYLQSATANFYEQRRVYG